MFLFAVDDNNIKTHINDAIIGNNYYCQECHEKVVLKKGRIRRHHFAHKSNNMCFEFKYDEMTKWHIDWQNRFPKENIEVIKTDENGNRCIADVLLNDVEIEFQHSSMPYEIFKKRNDFYNKYGYHVIWVFDGNNEFKKGYNDGPFPFLFDCFKHIKSIPEYLDIYIEGEVQPNLITESGLFLHHVSKIDEKKGIIFDKRISIDNFLDMVKNYKKDSKLLDDKYKMDTLINIINKNPDAERLIVYNSKTRYSYLLDKYNMNRFKQGQKLYGKYKKSNDYGSFLGSKVEIYYSKDPIWIYQQDY